jgi:N-methylhydantoinase B
MKFDRSETQVFANYCVAAAENMAYSLIRTAHSTFVKETEDFSCTIMTPGGLTFASPKTLGATWYAGLDFGPVIEMIDSYEEGDVCFTNDAYSGYVATHTPDVMMWKPVFYKGLLMCFVGGHIHNTDMGGAVPASLSRSLTEIQQEGIRFPPSKIVRKGVLDETLLNVMLINVRAPEQNRGDMQAQLASLATGERKLLEIIERFGPEYFSEGVDALLDYSEAQAKAVIKSIQNGTYDFADYADEDSDGGKPMRIALSMSVNDDDVLFDFSGSDPQLGSSLNVPTGGRERHVLALVALNYVLYSLNPNILLNAGMLRVARCILPEGSVVNPVAPAAVGMRSLSCMILQHVVFGAFSMAAPNRMPACPSTGMTILNVRTLDKSGATVMASIGPVGGGAGGSAAGDGSDASGANLAFLRNTPVEINEAEVPIRITRYGLVPGSSGAGEYRGGLGIMMEFKVFSPNTLVTARNRNGCLFSAWGIRGGKAGGASQLLKNPGLPNEMNLGNTDIVHCAPGDVVRCTGGGGGGYGNPLMRNPESVRRDVVRGFLTTQQAMDQYGVVFNGQDVDMDATQRTRAALGADGDLPHFSFAPARVKHEAVWTRERYDALTEVLGKSPLSWRFFIKHKIFDELSALDQASKLAAGASDVYRAFSELQSLHPALR